MFILRFYLRAVAPALEDTAIDDRWAHPAALVLEVLWALEVLHVPLMLYFFARLGPCLVALLLSSRALGQPAPVIDRRALVTRHDPSLTRVDPASPLMVGNGSIAITADITGLSTFQDRYSPRAPLTIRAQWAWHEFPNPRGHRYEQSLVGVPVRGKTQRFPWLSDGAQTKQPLIAWLRENPHRFALGRLSLYLLSEVGAPATFPELAHTRQTLELWSGRLRSKFELKGVPVEVETSVHPDLDAVIVQLRSPLLASGRLGVDLGFPGVSAQLNPDPADWSQPDTHRTTLLTRGRRGVSLERRLDATRYYVTTSADRDVEVRATASHAYRFTARGGDALTLLVAFSPEPLARALPDAHSARAAVARHWQNYWTRGGVVDFSGSTDPRAAELERRVILSQYLMAVNAAGRLPPQEEGLFSNSWNGKFHLEMHPWHAAHFALWGRAELLERSMPWYLEHLPRARARAREHGARGAWWPKMVGPEGRESPSTINPFIMWQQPHPILLAELIYRAEPTRAKLERYRELVFDTAELLASFPFFESGRDRYVLGPPIIPAQEVFPPLATYNPSFELEYFRFGLATAQLWRQRLGLPRQPEWDRVLARLSPLPQADGLYLATESQPELWTQARSARCSGGPAPHECLNRDHPSFLAALGFLPGASVERETMRRTLDAVLKHWDLRQTWGWDPPMLAMTAARLHEPARAVELLLRETNNYRFGVAGMTPRVQLEPNKSPPAPSGAARVEPSYQRVAEAYFPSNGALLMAVAMMAAGWDGESAPQPGFPKNGRWRVRSEGLLPLP